ncbi:MAG: hypothetical protein MR210_03930 [Erysipelotrichaceae bacterium]|nr:hypothetical protein [Erysipelotrichaceae bacterium]
MNSVKKALYVMSNDEVENKTINLIEDTIDVVLGDKAAAIKVMKSLAQFPFFIREQYNWIKLKMFFDGVYINEQDRAKINAMLMENGKKEDNALRLLKLIDDADGIGKISYLINATRCLLADFIDLTTYFRICHVVIYTLEEDLEFLKQNINNNSFEYSQYIQGLLTSGLVYQSKIYPNGDQEYSFTKLAYFTDQYALSYDDVNKYPNPSNKVLYNSNPKVDITRPTPITNKEIDQMFDDEN